MTWLLPSLGPAIVRLVGVDWVRQSVPQRLSIGASLANGG